MLFILDEKLTYSFVWTHILSSVRIYDCPLEVCDHSLQSFGGVFQIDSDVLHRCIGASLIPVGVGVITVVVASQAVVKPILLNDQLDGGVVGPLQAEESGHEVFSTLKVISQSYSSIGARISNLTFSIRS